MGSVQSKFRTLDYTCHEIVHTWDPSCTFSAVEVLLSCFKEGLKIYGSVYGVSHIVYISIIILSG